MWTDNNLSQLETAIASGDRPTIQVLCSRLIEHILEQDGAFDLKQSKRILSLLRRKRLFVDMHNVAEALLQSGQKAGIVRRQYAQSLIERGQLTAAIGALEKLIAECPDDKAEGAEARGLIGRALKQQYVDNPHRKTGAHRRALNDAVNSYYGVYAADHSYLWHGINAVACAKRADRDGVPLDAKFDRDVVATEILASVSKQPSDDVPHWDLATAAEACVALTRFADALEWIRQYVAKPVTEADAFEVASTLRQLETVWGLTEGGGPGGDLISVLKAALLLREGGGTRLSSKAPSVFTESTNAAFEKVFGDAGPRTYAWYMLGDTRARAVGRVEDRFGRGLGSGFLVSAADLLGSGPQNSLLFVTNSHVLGNLTTDALSQHEARVRFQAKDSNKTYAVESLVWESSSSELDATVVRLVETPTDVKPIPIGKGEEPEFAEGATRRYFIIGHPKGGELSMSLEDNHQVGWRNPLLHYRTPTHPGNSGSPVLDENWDLVALHHAGRHDMPRLDGHPGTYEANEGIWIHAIVKKLRGRAIESAGQVPEIPTKQAGEKRIDVFVSYSHKDRKFQGELQTVLRPLVRKGTIRLWSDMDIAAGANWLAEIRNAMSTASAAILLVSANYLASDFITEKEFSQLSKAAAEKGLKLVWVPVGDCLYQETWLNEIQAAIDPKSPLNKLAPPERQSLWVKIAKTIASA